MVVVSRGSLPHVLGRRYAGSRRRLEKPVTGGEAGCHVVRERGIWPLVEIFWASAGDLLIEVGGR